MRRLGGSGSEETISVELEGESVPAIEGEPVACSLLAAGETVFSRSVKYHRPRGPYCFTGACSQCLMRVDGVPNIFTCRTPARAGMRLERQNAFPSADFDVFAATDWMFPRGLDHHEMFAGVPVAQTVMAKVARHLAGLGLLPDAPAPERPALETLEVPVAILGGGSSGLATAEVLAQSGTRFLLVERESTLGGSLALSDLSKVPSPGAFPEGSLRLDTTVVGLYGDERGRFAVLSARNPQRLLKLYAKRFVLAVGGHPQSMTFENNDLPGIFAGQAVNRLIHRHRLLPGTRFAVVGQGPDVHAMSALIEQSGGEVVVAVDSSGEPPPGGAKWPALEGEPVKAYGRSRVRGLAVRARDGRSSKYACDSVVICLPVSPSFELARQAGARIHFDQATGVFVVEASAEGQTAEPNCFVTGQLTGPTTVELSADKGRRAARAVVSELAGEAR